MKVRLHHNNDINQQHSLRLLTKRSTKLTKHIVAMLSVMFINACSTPSGISSESTLAKIKQNTPEHWSQNHNDDRTNLVSYNGWLKSFNDNTLETMVDYALQKNYQLKAERINVELAKKQLDITKASNYPELSLSLDNARRKVTSSNTTNYQTDASISADLRYELDIWGKLSDEQHQSHLRYAAAEASYHQKTLDLVANITSAWFNLSQAQQLLHLYQERADNLKRNLAMIQSSYQLGLNDALDVYLTKNNVNQELARVAQQQQTLKQQSRALELLLGDYPLADTFVDQTLPIIETDIELGLPAQLLTRRADIQASWLELLALDAGLAVAHKQRFPSINITASVSDGDNDIAKLLDGGALAWSLLGSLSAPIFNAGRLESLEQQARLSVEQKEQQYLQQVYQAFADLENNLSERDSLNQRYQYYVKAQENAMAAEKLSFDQYLRGLVTYTTVLESQRRSFDAQTTVIQLTNQLLQNRINIYSTLGGNYLHVDEQAQQRTHQNKDNLPISIINRANMEK